MKKKTYSKRKYREHLRTHIALISIVTLCVACVAACIIVVVPTLFLYHGPLTLKLVFILCLLVCTLAMLIGGVLLYFVSGRISALIQNSNETVNKIAKGDFNARTDRIEVSSEHYEYRNELDELEANVNKMASELSGMDYMRKDFMSNVSHEVKTPVAAITGFSEMLLDDNLSDSQRREYLEIINAESKNLSVLCENMLSMSRLDYQEIITNSSRIRLDEQLRQCAILLSRKWDKKNISFDMDLDEVTIYSDKSLVMQLWTNIIDNSIKYSNNTPWIKISVKTKEDKAIVTISDKGIGIAPEKLDRIYERFYQCEESHKKYGNGLGLSIAKRIVEIISGTIKYESTPGLGTTVTVTLQK